MIKSHITDPSTGIQASVDNDNGLEPNSLVVATRPLKQYQNKIVFFANPTYGPNMNQDASTGGVPENVHDGLDNVYWTGSQIAGGADVTFNSALQNHTPAGAQSIYFNQCETDDVVEFDNGADIDLSGYVSLSFWVYIDANFGIGDSFEIYMWDNDLNVQVGDRVNMENYIDIGTLRSWQQASIPLTDMNVDTSTTADALRIRCANTVAVKPTFFIDDIQFEETGAPLTYTISADKGTWLRVKGFNVFIADAYAGTLADATMPNIPYDAFLGVSSLNSGIIYQRTQDGTIVNSASIKQMSDLMQFSNATIGGSGSDGTNTWVNIIITFAEEIILKAENADTMKLTISEDLSGLLVFRVGVACAEELRGLE